MKRTALVTGANRGIGLAIARQLAERGNAVLLGSRDPDGYAVTQHRFHRPGDYVVRVEGRGADRTTAVGHLKVRVGEPGAAAP